MNREMFAHPATQRNLAQLAADSAQVLGVGFGDQACGEVGDGRMLEPTELLKPLLRALCPKFWLASRSSSPPDPRSRRSTRY